MNYLKLSQLSIGVLLIVSSICMADDSLKRFYYYPTGFSAEIPQYWKLRQKDDENMYDIAGISPFEDPEDNFQEFFIISINKSPSTISIDEHSALNKKSLEMVLGDFEIVEDTHISLKSGIVKKLVYLYGPNRTVKKMVFFGLHNEHLYEIKFTSTTKDYQKFSDLFDKIIYSVEIDKT